MIIGIGTDITEIARIKSSVERLGERFIDRILTSNEKSRYQAFSHPEQACAFVAKRFAAKEAAAKALGTGIARGVGFQHFEIANNEWGKPYLVVSAEVSERLPEGAKWHLSISDERHYAQAFVIIEEG